MNNTEEKEKMSPESIRIKAAELRTLTEMGKLLLSDDIQRALKEAAALLEVQAITDAKDRNLLVMIQSLRRILTERQLLDWLCWLDAYAREWISSDEAERDEQLNPSHPMTFLREAKRLARVRGLGAARRSGVSYAEAWAESGLDDELCGEFLHGWNIHAGASLDVKDEPVDGATEVAASVAARSGEFAEALFCTLNEVMNKGASAPECIAFLWSGLQQFRRNFLRYPDELSPAAAEASARRLGRSFQWIAPVNQQHAEMLMIYLMHALCSGVTVRDSLSILHAMADPLKVSRICNMLDQLDSEE